MKLILKFPNGSKYVVVLDASKKNYLVLSNGVIMEITMNLDTMYASIEVFRSNEKLYSTQINTSIYSLSRILNEVINQYDKNTGFTKHEVK